MPAEFHCIRRLPPYVFEEVNRLKAVNFYEDVFALAMAFSKLLIEEANVAISAGVAFGENGEGFVRIALVENEHRMRQAARSVRKLLDRSGQILSRAPDQAPAP